ncbi:hypothetical protein BC828DRAFT_70068 [Blastocladiella britannica]|nr:hypothetical protein BC828DRAFT_70068 [Blastocladiella britannica]
MVPTLTTATAPMVLWMRLRIDDCTTTRANLAGEHHDDPLWDPAAVADEPFRLTLPTHWAVVAAGEGRASVLEFLVTKLAVDPFQLTAFLSRKYPTFQFFLSLIQHSTMDRVMPTWRWLIANGYQYPVEECGFLSILAARAAEYQTMRMMFFEYDKPQILAEPDRATRLELYEGVNECVWGWVSEGYYDLFPEFAEVGILTPRCTFPHLYSQERAVKLYQFWPLIASLASHIEGGMDAAIDYGLDCDFKDMQFTILLTYWCRIDELKERMNKHHHHPHFVEALAAASAAHGEVDRERLLIDMVNLFRRETVLEPGDDPEDLQFHIADFRFAVLGVSELLVEVLCSNVDSKDAATAAAVWAAIEALSPAHRVAMLGEFARIQPRISCVAYPPAPIRHCPPRCQANGPHGSASWTACSPRHWTRRPP